MFCSLGMKDSWGPLKALAVASAVNGVGDIILCSFLGYGIAGAAWATMVSQVRSDNGHQAPIIILFKFCITVMELPLISAHSRLLQLT